MNGRKISYRTGCGWCMSIIPATQEAEIAGSQLEASPGKVSKKLSQK
jgi:hypothetical protein